jgi:hypothetical protein
MVDSPGPSHTTALVLQAIEAGYIDGYPPMEAAGLSGGTSLYAEQPERHRLDDSWRRFFTRTTGTRPC